MSPVESQARSRIGPSWPVNSCVLWHSPATSHRTGQEKQRTAQTRSRHHEPIGRQLLEWPSALTNTIRSSSHTQHRASVGCAAGCAVSSVQMSLSPPALASCLPDGENLFAYTAAACPVSFMVAAWRVEVRGGAWLLPPTMSALADDDTLTSADDEEAADAAASSSSCVRCFFSTSCWLLSVTTVPCTSSSACSLRFSDMFGGCGGCRCGVDSRVESAATKRCCCCCLVCGSVCRTRLRVAGIAAQGGLG